MKANLKSNLSKVITFLSFISIIFSFISCKPEEIKIDPILTIGEAKNIGMYSAVIEANFTPNTKDSLAVSFEYREMYYAWKTQTLPLKFSGFDAIKITWGLQELKPGVQYQFCLVYGVATRSEIATFTTATTANNSLVVSQAEKVTLNSADVNLHFIPRYDNTVVALEYSTNQANWQTNTMMENYSGSKTVYLTFHLTDLAANTIYYYRVKTTNYNETAVSDIYSVKTYALVDYDGNYYHTITIGTQTWLQENFKGTHYANGDPIPNITDQTAWGKQTSGAYCWYENNYYKYGSVYGGLYNWYVATDSRGLIPGYHTPSYDEWITLSDYLGGHYIAGDKLKEVGTTHWNAVTNKATNSSGFTALPSGCRTEYRFEGLPDIAYFWTTSLIDNSCAYIFYLGSSLPRLNEAGNDFIRGQCIRLVQN